MDIMRSDIGLNFQGRDNKTSDRLEKAEINGERALDEIYSYKEHLRQLKDERKRDIEETADFIK